MNNTLQSTKKRKFSAVITLIIAVAVMLTSTYAWSSISQSATNYIYGGDSGGRVHDDFDGENKDVFAENYGTTPLFVRIMLTEFMSIGGVPFEPGSTFEDRDTWTPHIPVTSSNPLNDDPSFNVNVEGGRQFRDYVTWTMGGHKIFMPTFNHDNTCLRTNTTGIGMDDIDGGPNAYGDGSHGMWQVGDYHEDYLTRATGAPIWRRHYARSTLQPTTTAMLEGTPVMPNANNGVITMAQWELAGRPTGAFWVIDVDGWSYWAQPLWPGEATSLLLDQIHVNPPGGGRWEYAINVIGQFATVDYLDMFDDATTNARDLLNRAADLSIWSNVPIGTTIRYDGTLWLILHEDSNGNRLIISANVFGIDSIQYRYNLGNTWNPLNSSNLRASLNAWYANNVPDSLHEIARPVGNLTDTRGGPGGFVATEQIAGDMTYAATGTVSANGSNALFILSVSEVNAYFTDNGLSRIGTCLARVTRPWWTRSPGLNAGLPAVQVMPNGDINPINADAWGRIRPAMWISPD